MTDVKDEVIKSYYFECENGSFRRFTDSSQRNYFLCVASLGLMLFPFSLGMTCMLSPIKLDSLIPNRYVIAHGTCLPEIWTLKQIRTSYHSSLLKIWSFVAKTQSPDRVNRKSSITEQNTASASVFQSNCSQSYQDSRCFPVISFIHRLVVQHEK